MTRKKKAAQSKALATLSAKQQKGVGRRGKEDRRAAKLERRRKEKKAYTAEAWAEPAPQHLVAKLDLPKHSSKYQSYFEFAENKEKKKKLEFQVTNDPNPPPGFAYVPIGDPTMTNACKELSREQDAMIFIVSRSKEDNSKISDHIFRTGYHFREVIVDEARRIVGDTVVSSSTGIEPIPESQTEINTQADAAIRDLFPRIPNTDRQMIIEHAFQKGVKFHGEPTVGLQADLPLSRRVQLAVLAHIRHTHTRYDKLLRETSWINARKVVEPVCLDVLVKWRGDEETGRDQMDEILREVVIITDSDDEDESSDEDDTSSEDGDPVSAEPSDRISALTLQQAIPNGLHDPRPQNTIPSHTTATARSPEGVRRLLPRFKRYQAAWDEAVSRRQIDGHRPEGSDFHEASMRIPPPNASHSSHDPLRQLAHVPITRPPIGTEYVYRESQPRLDRPPDQTRYYLQEPPTHRTVVRRDEVTVRTIHDRPVYQGPLRHSTPLYVSREPRPQVAVTASSPKRAGLQDMLVPSIETVQIDGTNDSPRINRGDVAGESRPYQESYPRKALVQHRPSPAYRELIVTDEANSHLKRRRVLEDDYGRFRPLPPNEPQPFATPHYDSDPQSFYSRDDNRRYVPLARHAQGLSTNMPFSSIRPAYPERGPVYEISNPSLIEMHSGSFRRREIDMGHNQPLATSLRREMVSPHAQYRNAHEEGNSRRVDENMRVVEHDNVMRSGEVQPSQRHYLQRPASPVSHANGINSSYDMGPATADQHFIQRFSESQPESSLSRPQIGLNSSYERVPRNILRPSQEPSQAARSLTHVRHAQVPMHYLERPEFYREGSRQPVHYERRAPYDLEPRLSHSGMRELAPPEVDMPVYRYAQPRRQVIALE